MATANHHCTQECDTRRGNSMEPATKKRQVEEAELMSNSAPIPKRHHYEEASPCPREDTVSAAPASVFNMPTGCVHDRFSLSESLLGSGQFGSVRECTDLFTGERLACKTIRKVAAPREDGAAPRQHADLRNEVGVMMRLGGHDNLVQLRGVFEDSEQVHLVMDLCQGGELFEEVVRRQRFGEADAAHLFAEITRSVAFCHARGVLHRDLKPENMLLRRKLPEGVPVSEAARAGPVVKLVDFGLATTLAAGQRVKGIAGSPFYMAPEVLTGEYDFKADVWSLGVVLYILLCGSPPFWGEKDEDVFQAILKGKPDMVSGPWAEVSPEAKNLVRCLLLQDTAKRPSAQKVLTHPWLVKHTAPRVAALRRPVAARAEAVPVRVV